MEKVFFAQKAFIVHHHKLLLIRKRDDAKQYPGKWEVPGGRMEENESIEAHIAREVMEEVGIEVEAHDPFFIWDWFIDDGYMALNHVIAVAIHCVPLSFNVTIENQINDEIDCCKWVEISDLKKYDFIPNMIPVVEAFIAQYSKSNN